MLDIDKVRVELSNILASAATEDARGDAPLIAHLLMIFALRQESAKKDLQCTNRSLKLLSGMEADLVQLAKKLQQMGVNEKLALNLNGGLSCLQIAQSLLEIGQSVIGAKVALQGAPMGRRGRPSKDAAAGVAERLARLYPHLTGKRAGAGRNPITGESGPFVILLGEVLDVLGLKDPETNAEHFAKRACKQTARNQPINLIGAV